jgi:hypothetical protein
VADVMIAAFLTVFFFNGLFALVSVCYHFNENYTIRDGTTKHIKSTTIKKNVASRSASTSKSYLISTIGSIHLPCPWTKN